ncbi:MAG TPA: radical SAM protein [Archaeoglobaceae archaeon]|nr:radical SAM protein [Archaeoglobaceae archaeon]
MEINWMIPRSFVDYPSEISCVLGFRNCNLNCNFCSNWRVVNQDYKKITLDHIRQIFETDPIITATTLTGGEPSTDIPLMRKIIRLAKDNNLKVSVQTNGLLLSEIADLDIDLFQIDLKLFLSKEIISSIIKTAISMIDDDRLKFTVVLFDNFPREKLKLICNQLVHIEGIIGIPQLARKSEQRRLKPLEKSSLAKFKRCIDLRPYDYDGLEISHFD